MGVLSVSHSPCAITLKDGLHYGNQDLSRVRDDVENDMQGIGLD